MSMRLHVYGGAFLACLNLISGVATAQDSAVTTVAKAPVEFEQIQLVVPRKRIIFAGRHEFELTGFGSGQIKQSAFQDSCKPRGDLSACREKHKTAGVIQSAGGEKAVLEGSVVTDKELTIPKKTLFDAVTGSQSIPGLVSAREKKSATISLGTEAEDIWRFVSRHSGITSDEIEYAGYIENGTRLIEIKRYEEPCAETGTTSVYRHYRYEFVESGQLLGTYREHQPYPIQIRADTDAATRMTVIAAMMLRMYL